MYSESVVFEVTVSSSRRALGGGSTARRGRHRNLGRQLGLSRRRALVFARAMSQIYMHVNEADWFLNQVRSAAFPAAAALLRDAGHYPQIEKLDQTISILLVAAGG